MYFFLSSRSFFLWWTSSSYSPSKVQEIVLPGISLISCVQSLPASSLVAMASCKEISGWAWAVFGGPRCCGEATFILSCSSWLYPFWVRSLDLAPESRAYVVL